MTLKQKARPSEVTITRNKYKLNHVLFLAFLIIILMTQTLLYHYNYIITNDVIKTAIVNVKVNVKFAQNMSWGTTGGAELLLYSYFNHSARWGWVVNATLRPFSSGEREKIPIAREVGWVLMPVWTGTKYLAPTRIWSLDRAALSE
jgi:hypothetical protein